MKYIVAIFVLIPSYSLASVWDDFKNKFSQERIYIDTQLAVAKNLKATQISTENEISAEECLVLQEKISANYSSNPFKKKTVFGELEGVGCSSSISKTFKNYFSQRSIKSQFGVESKYVLQTVGQSTLFDFQHITSYLLDENYRLLEEIQFRFRDLKKSQQPWAIRIVSTDAAGNMYAHYFHTGYIYKHLLDKVNFVAANGLVPEATRVVSSWVDSPELFHIENRYVIAQPEAKAWDKYELFLPLAMSGGFYTVGTKVNVHPPAYRTYSIKYRNDKFLCDYGYIRKDGEETNLPNNDDAIACLKDY